MMKKGFITMATGHERYYLMAYNLVRSYRYFTNDPFPFCIISDRTNQYTDAFDDVVIIDNPQKNYMDKIELLKLCPYDENIFIDADCLAYSDLNVYWDAFKNADDFSVFGEALPLDSKSGWFKKEDTGEFQNKIQFVTHLHGVIYFMRKTEMLNTLYDTCQYIAKHYNEYHFRGFPKPADESILSLAIAIHGLKPTHREPRYYIFVPVATRLIPDISKGSLAFENKKDGFVTNGCLVHWANVNTGKWLYKREVQSLNALINSKNPHSCGCRLRALLWLIKDMYKDMSNKALLEFRIFGSKIKQSVKALFK